MSHKLQNVVVIGGGIVGLSVATIIQERYPDCNIDIYASKVDASTTSWGAAGFLRYNCKNFEEDSGVDECRWLSQSENYFWNLFRSPECAEAGVLLTNFYQISESPIIVPDCSTCLYEGIRRVKEKELRAVGFSSRFKHGVSFISTLTESRYYLPFLARNLISKGVNIIHEKISEGKVNVANWALKKGYDVVVNCAGLGSRELFEDIQCIPVRGQIVRVDAPWMKFSFLTDDDTYAYTGKESVILGGIRQKNDWDLSVRPEDSADILKRITEQFICLGNSKVIEEWVGLRPWRPKLRLEIEYIESSSGEKVPVVHNYGHGSSGIGLSWGTSLAAVDLIVEVQNLPKYKVNAKL